MGIPDDLTADEGRRIRVQRARPKGRKRRLPENPRSKQTLERTLARLKPPPKNPLEDPLAGIKRPLKALNGPVPGRRHTEFEAIDVLEIRQGFYMTQRQFARLMGINVKTLRNWEQGRRRPHGPSRALLRVAAAKPKLVAEVLLRHKRIWWLDF
ncbi:MAG TPA: helix-turn-helix domain-containing protein [Vicinamibacterales bacterium]|nr:helix-turn-helix domain-containing protein [Vicinamibacterales bacterium]